jgi:hypothetical protein
MADLNCDRAIGLLVADDRLRAFVRDGRVTAIPTKQAKRRLLLDALAQAFEPGVRYPERVVSDFLATVHDDYAALRRYLVDGEFLSRDHGEYWRSAGTVDLSAPADLPVPAGSPAPANSPAPVDSHPAGTLTGRRTYRSAIGPAAAGGQRAAPRASSPA